jgi:Uma2 family endonuclease
MSPTDNLDDAQAKMQEYMDNFLRLGWLLHRKAKQVEIYYFGHSLRELEAGWILVRIAAR